mmetsp:Transcript_11538/g.29095  ORF Transcript_11538/g.29095 Transcript_11538/m.29095 type:complete len:361 (-) Transcript_11538:132-1214(-)|eukprot:CAMPEP_0177643302 /NCGR_PEP_ID=MMETSP0447-20121125/8085_1 /TAXON_ID=0 /ORGANISM="Stygamoeba regulata, Strain BSH-02190019" /LENGTH=360 /DNA_ID=CAMNT_0019145593 /DNA_START=192 /DNA_END=1274 /DNA_ORIENTATION=+
MTKKGGYQIHGKIISVKATPGMTVFFTWKKKWGKGHKGRTSVRLVMPNGFAVFDCPFAFASHSTPKMLSLELRQVEGKGRPQKIARASLNLGEYLSCTAESEYNYPLWHKSKQVGFSVKFSVEISLILSVSNGTTITKPEWLAPNEQGWNLTATMSEALSEVSGDSEDETLPNSARSGGGSRLEVLPRRSRIRSGTDICSDPHSPLPRANSSDSTRRRVTIVEPVAPPLTAATKVCSDTAAEGIVGEFAVSPGASPRRSISQPPARSRGADPPQEPSAADTQTSPPAGQGGLSRAGSTAPPIVIVQPTASQQPHAQHDECVAQQGNSLCQPPPPDQSTFKHKVLLLAVLWAVLAILYAFL